MLLAHGTNIPSVNTPIIDPIEAPLRAKVAFIKKKIFRLQKLIFLKLI